MLTVFYHIVFAISLLLSCIYLYIWNKRFDVSITMVFTLVPIANLGVAMTSMAHNIPELITGLKISYIGGCFLQFFITLSILKLCDINIHKVIKSLCFILCILFYVSILTIGRTKLFYKDIYYEKMDGAIVDHRVYGPMHTAFYVVVIIYLIIGIAAIIYSYRNKNQIPNSILELLILPEIITIFGYFGGKIFGSRVEFVVFTYVFAQIIYLIIVRRLSLYSISDSVVDSIVQTGETGIISIDLKYKYLGSNKTARKIITELKDVSVDDKITDYQTFKKNIIHWLEMYESDGHIQENLYRVHADNSADDKIYKINVSNLYIGSIRRGYQILISDDTKNQQYIALLDNYNSELEEEVDEKTRHIVEMHNNLILGMATMVESRDNSTGGHIKRTSIGVQILVDEIRKAGKLNLSEEFCKDLIKAAPMHDIGKISVDDAILRKPGRFTDEEYEIMKRHAPEGAKIIREILKDTDDESFKIIAENVAHYHHEKWDGTGYPDGLKGEEIPLEARIMAIADVYDALVSKRVYKDRMSFEKADAIIMESMGSHFDKSLEPYYVSARPRLEKYYSELEDE